MSNGLHHVAPPSFFPTAKELSSGLQWFKEHPILAAAAATAVSVITYLHTAEDDDVEVDATHGDLAAADGDDADSDQSRPQAHDTMARAPPTRTPRRRASSPSMVTSDATTTRTSPPPVPAIRKPGSEGKMSPAGVSWVDEHGGSLTEVFEHFSVGDEDDDDHEGVHGPYPDLDGPLRASQGINKPPQGRPPTPRRPPKPADLETTAESDESARVASPQSTHWMGPLGVPSSQQPTGASTPLAAGDRQTESPQWGWYVPITPPQDHLTGSASSLPRAVVVAPTSATQSAAHGVNSLHRSSVENASSMRRSASGRIKAA